MMKTTVLNYDTATYDFRGLIAAYLGVDNLDHLRAQYATGGDRSENSIYKNMEQSPLFQRLYAGLNGEDGHKFYALYERFVRQVIRPQYDGAIYYQEKPSHRIVFADNPGQSRFHRDRDYGHAAGEVNYLLVQTAARGNNAMWIESAEGRADYRPLELEVGQYGRFKGVDLSHGARLNDTGRSRVSFDFRVIPAAEAPARYRRGERKDDEGNPVRDNAMRFRFMP